ncbi:hypothetical protein K1T71_011451 [Dendrolimus kikuchii]|uniref:Uncharacterized protein n=1 Tax=Dendrolimus kikuchii TaxID=765133 RepID=A0ACC1CP30_9NEOP|nr:hypothetical protein K1T71_011451 [Dendrolimus kikuchii]
MAEVETVAFGICILRFIGKRNFFRGLSIPEGGVHIVGGELGDAFIAFSTDEDARQAMMLDGGKIKEIQVKLLLSSRSEMHKVIEAARQSVPLMSLAAPAAVVVTAPAAPAPAPIITPAPQPAHIPAPVTPFSAALGTNPLASFGIPGLGNPQEIPQPAVIEPPAPMVSPTDANNSNPEDEKEEEKIEQKRNRERERRRTRSRSRSRDRDRKDRKRDRRDRSRSRDRRRRDRSRSRDRRDRKRDRKDRSRSRDRSPSRRSRDWRTERRSPRASQEKAFDTQSDTSSVTQPPFENSMNRVQSVTPTQQGSASNGPQGGNEAINRFSDPSIAEAYNKLQELGKKRNPNAFQGDQQNGVPRSTLPARGGFAGANNNSFRREGRERPSRFDNDQQGDCCVAIRNASKHTSYGDVRRFFPFLIDKHGIKMINDNMGRRTGNIYVRFCDSRSRQLALQRKNIELKGAMVTVEALEDEAYESAVDSFLPYREDNDEDDVSLVIADPEEVPQPSFNVLKLSELPNYVKEHDLVKAFSNFSLLSIIIKDCRITRTKIAFVEFAKPEEARSALEKKESFVFGRRQPTIESVLNEDFEKEKQIQVDKVPEKERHGIEEQPKEVSMPRDPRQRRQFDMVAPQQANPPPTMPAQASTPAAPFFGAPFVPQQVYPPNFVGPAFGGYPGPGTLDPRTAASNWANRPTFPKPAELIPKSISTHVISTEMEDQPLDCVLMKGLPRHATDRTIVTFLAGTGAVPARIHLMLDGNGLPSGDCFCEFRSTQEARMATTKHGSDLEGSRVTVDLVPRSVVEEALEGPKQLEHPPQEGLLGNAPPLVQQQFFEPIRGGFQPRGGYRGRGGGYERGFRGGFRGRGGYDRGTFHERGRGFERSRGRGFSRGRGAVSGFENGRTEEENDPALEDFGAPGCIVSMENVPFRATIEEILSFFSEFEITQDDIIRRFNERGQPTGDARVAFRTPFDAQRAVKTRHMDTIHDRRISLGIL